MGSPDLMFFARLSVGAISQYRNLKSHCLAFDFKRNSHSLNIDIKLQSFYIAILHSLQ